jgi:hypothetical protein
MKSQDAIHGSSQGGNQGSNRSGDHFQANWGALLSALDATPTPVPFFVRDDDAGWDDARLFALLDTTEAAGVPMDLALIPQATQAALATALGRRKQAAPDLIGLHQHGFAHTNHETTARKCEFGDARSLHAQRADLQNGRAHLQALLGPQLDAIFTPPWNRCAAHTPALLADLGFAVLSRSRGAAAQQALPELPVDVDWCKHRRLALAQGEDGSHGLASALAQRVTAGGPVGLMLHHAAMDLHDLRLLRSLLQITHRHPQVNWRLMSQLSVCGESLATRPAASPATSPALSPATSRIAPVTAARGQETS